MKKEWKVYIRGNKDRGDDVIKALIDLGAKNSIPKYEGKDSTALYYIRHDGEICIESEESEYGKIIMDNYREIKLPKEKQWEDGDILTTKDNNNLFCVYWKPSFNEKGFMCHVYVSKDTLFTGVTIPLEAADNYRKATDAEKSTFYSLIDNRHMRWDDEKKQLVYWRLKDKEELPEQWKDGDLLVCHMLSGNRYAVYSDDSELMECNTIITYVDVDNHTYGINGLFDKDDFKLASDKEHAEFCKLLHKHGVDWDTKKRLLVNWKRKPKYGDMYWVINTDGYVKAYIWNEDSIDNKLFNLGNYFYTKKEAETMAEKFKKLLKDNL